MNADAIHKTFSHESLKFSFANYRHPVYNPPAMKQGIHPQLHADAVTTCISCGAKFPIPTTVKVQQVEVCAFCHPVYTGEYRGIMASGRVDRFRKVSEASKKKQEEVQEIEKKRDQKPVAKKKQKRSGK